MLKWSGRPPSQTGIEAEAWAAIADEWNYPEAFI